MFGFKDAKKASVQQAPSVKEYSLAGSNIQPVEGQLTNIVNVNDPAFSCESMGPGLAIIPKKGMVVAPCDCTVLMTFPTGYAIGIKTDSGEEILIHVGIDTVSLNGKYFKLMAQDGQSVTKGSSLIEFNLEGLIKEGFDPTVMVILTNAENKEKPLGFKEA